MRCGVVPQNVATSVSDCGCENPLGAMAVCARGLHAEIPRRRMEQTRFVRILRKGLCAYRIQFLCGVTRPLPDRRRMPAREGVWPQRSLTPTQRLGQAALFMTDPKSAACTRCPRSAGGNALKISATCATVGPSAAADQRAARQETTRFYPEHVTGCDTAATVTAPAAGFG